MRILFIAENFPLPEKGEYQITGGVEAVALSFALWLKEKHELHIITNKKREQISSSDLNIIQCGKKSSYSQRGGLIARASFPRHAIKKGIRLNPDVVIGWNFMSYLPALKIAQKCSVPSIAWYPDVWIGRWLRLFGLPGLMGELLEHRVLRGNWSKYIAISDWTQSKLIENGIKPDMIEVVPPPVSIPDNITHQTSESPSIVVVSRLVSYKRIDVVLNAFAQVSKEFPEIHLEIVGDGPDRERLLNQARNLNIADKITWHGWIESHLDVISIIANGTIYLTASEVEGFGISTIEAAALGLPFVASDIPAIRFATRNGQGGTLFEPGNVTGCANALVDLLTDSAYREKKSEKARELGTCYNIEKLGLEFEKILVQICDQ